MNETRAQHPISSKTSTAFLVSLAVLFGVLVSGGFGTDVAWVEAADGVVSGRVYQDFDSDGSYDTAVAVGTATDIGLSGISVRAFDATGAQVGSTTTGSDGTYSLAVTSASTSAVRVEFSLPSSGPLTAMAPSFVGSQNGTSIRFVDIGATNVDMGYNVPGEYCQNNPNLSVSRLCAGASAQIPASPSAWVTRYDLGPYDTSHGYGSSYNTSYNNWAATTSATQSQTGSILGMAWDAATRRVYHSAYIRRHALMYEISGVPKPGALFVTTPQGITASEGVGGTTSFLVDLELLLDGDQFSNSNSAGPGFIPSNSVRKIQYMQNTNVDGGAENDGVDSDLVTGQDGVFEEVGRAGIGDIATDGSGNLYVVSLYDKHAYKVVLPAGAAPTTMTSIGDITSGVTCTNGTGRPFSVKFWRGALYFGIVCDAADDFNPATPRVRADTNLSFTIRQYDLATSTWSTFFGPHPLNSAGRIQKGSPNSGDMWARSTYVAWNPWTSSYADTYDANGAPDYSIRPQPMLSEIEFDRDGSMILAFRDRNGDIMGTWQSEAPDGSSTPFSIASGDVYRVCRTGTGYAGADYTFEGVTGCQPTPTPAHFSNSTDAVRQGIEYYWGDFWWQIGQGGHGETSSGLILQAPGFPDLFTTAFDPNGLSGDDKTWYSGGVRSLLNSTGGPSGSPHAGSGVQFYVSLDTNIAQMRTGGFLKVNGMSDIEALCDQAPVQIGNRVWIDTDLDGVQDPGETPVAGVTVRLYDATGTTLLGTAVTDANGEYYFSSTLGSEAAAGNGDREGGGLVAGTSYVVRFDNPADYAQGGPLYSYGLTTQNATDSVSNLDDLIDSDASYVAIYPQITTASIRPGVNDHSYDVGFGKPAVSVGDFVWLDTDKDGVQDAGESGIANVTLTITKADGSPVVDVNGQAVTTTTTDANGYYTFGKLPFGQYKVTVTPPAGYAATIANAGSDTGVDSSTGSATSRNLTVSGERDPSLDFGFVLSPTTPTTTTVATVAVKRVSVGDYVWWDIDRDGIQDANEKPIPGVTLTITKADGSPVTDVNGRPVTTTVTDAKGRYSFDNLPVGQYKVTVTPPAGATATKAGAGKNTAKDSSTGSATSRNMTTDGDRDPTLDFGFYKPTVSVGNFVWRDTNGDGVQSKADKGVAGFRLTLRSVDGGPVVDAYGRPVKPIRTKSDGKFLFKDLTEGRYVVEITYPRGYLPTTPNRADRGLNSSTLTAVSKSLKDGESDMTLDFGVVKRPGEVYRLLPATR